jgi:16S rRNA processing protein RimM
METKSNFFELGTIIRSHGIKGEVVIYVDADEPKRYGKLKTLFLSDGTEYIEKNIISMRINDNLATVMLEGVTDRNTSDLYIKKKVYLPVDMLPSLNEKQFYFHEVIGFTVTDLTIGSIGEITNVYELPQHPVIAVIYKGKEVLIPATSHFIIAVNRKDKVLEMDLPDGLLEVYTE